MFQCIAKGYDSANERISLGMQKRWKRALIDRLCGILPYRGALLDVCCGTGDIALGLGRQRRDVTVIGLDFSPAMLEIAKRRGGALKNLRFMEGNALSLPFPDKSFHAATISFGLRNTSDYEKTISELYRVVKPGGLVLCMDSFVPENKIILPFYRFYFIRLMPFLGGGRKYFKEYRWLSRSTELFISPGEVIKLFSKTGLDVTEKKAWMFGSCTLICGRKTE